MPQILSFNAALVAIESASLNIQHTKARDTSIESGFFLMPVPTDPSIGWLNLGGDTVYVNKVNNAMVRNPHRTQISFGSVTPIDPGMFNTQVTTSLNDVRNSGIEGASLVVTSNVTSGAVMLRLSYSTGGAASSDFTGLSHGNVVMSLTCNSGTVQTVGFSPTAVGEHKIEQTWIARSPKEVISILNDLKRTLAFTLVSDIDGAPFALCN